MRTAFRTFDSSCSWRQGKHIGSRPRATSCASCFRHFMHTVPAAGMGGEGVEGRAPALLPPPLPPPQPPSSPHWPPLPQLELGWF
jgi:hypothetical protein